MIKKTFKIHAENFKQIALTMKAFEKTYGDSVENYFIGKDSEIILKEEGGVKNIFKFTLKNDPTAMDISDFIKHYFPDPRKNPLA